jgi:putative pyruvate formate lyase activating enzyme
MYPTYLTLLASGELEERSAALNARLASCDLCPWKCQADRTSSASGVCRNGSLAYLASYGPHLGEEAPLRGWRGSGTIFFSQCNLRCQFCQNYDISQTNAGEAVGTDRLAEVMLTLQEWGCHNINLVSPTHVVPQFVSALLIAARAGLRLPLVYNSGGYDSVKTLQLLDGIVDIYMPDMKYASSAAGSHYSKAKNYPEINQMAVKEMHRQVGDLDINSDGLARRGLLVRHLVLPGGLAGTGEIVSFLVGEISPDTYINIMDQYRPAYNAHLFPMINRPIRQDEHRQAVKMALQGGLHRLDQQI